MTTSSTGSSTASLIFRITAAVIVLAVLLLTPAPLLPPHFLAEKIQFYTGGIRWKFAYLIAAIGLQGAFFFSIGLLSAFTVRRATDWRKRLLQVFIIPVVVTLAALLIRSLKMGHFPVWINAAIPIGAGITGVWIGLGLLYQRSMLIFLFIAVVVGISFWALSGSITPELTKSTEVQLQQLITSSKNFPAGEDRFGALLKTAFAPAPGTSQTADAIQHNRAAILALGIAVADERLAKFVELNNHELLKQASKLRKGTTLRGRNDWTRHFCLSAALAVLENPLVSDAGGLLKEQLDALSGGSGFSFGDFAADRAGVRFAQAATNSEEDAIAMQEFLQREYDVNNFLPPIADLPENMTPEQFREKFGATGSETYRNQVNAIENRLDSCKALSPLISGK